MSTNFEANESINIAPAHTLMKIYRQIYYKHHLLYLNIIYYSLYCR